MLILIFERRYLFYNLKYMQIKLWFLIGCLASSGVLAGKITTDGNRLWFEAQDLSAYNQVDPDHKIPELAKKKALAYFEMYKDRISNKEYLSVFDASQISGKPRLHLIHLPSGKTQSFLVAHGRGSDQNHDGLADLFSNREQSNATSLGFYMTGTTYQGSNGLSLRLQGLEATNSNAEKRAIVIHGAEYVNPQMAALYNKVGRSLGCPAIESKYTKYLTDRIRNGSVFYIWKP